ncbi:hypothetical protein [Agathobaculum sp.]|uniref:hypothetical protein n=1 Tax=Agathobaculum sp. TaxID=2048138 RepID=UPI0039A14675
MSVLTEVLKLFKYDPATDGDMTFNIGQCMNDNWDKLDAAILLAIAAAGAYNPEESYAVGDYCTYKGKLRKCSTAIPTGETWTEAHWTTTTVAAEMQELSSQLSNRLRHYTSFEALGLTEATATVASIVAAMSDSSMLAAACATDGKNAGWLPESYGFLRIHKVNIDYAMAEYQVVWPNAELWRGYYNAGDDGLKWSGWQPIATATPPQEFVLPLAEGFVHYDPSTKSTYSKSQEGLVVVHFYCKKADGTDIVQNDTIAMLPEGFHPSANVHIPANVSYDRGSVYSQDVATVVADPTGRVWIAFPPAGCKAVTTTLVFYAAS